ncbi:hypothetical protein M1615_02570 [Patescibacteria group bacterium]|nr:hypothetical protein [Patescibacteria group bacterium]
MTEVQPKGVKENNIDSQQHQSAGRIESVAAAAGAVSWPLLGLSYIFESQLKPVEGPIEFAALASLFVYIGARANR